MEVAIKTIHFTCIGRGHGAPCFPATRETWEMMRREKWLKEMCERIEKGDDELKHRLPVWTPHCAEYNDNHRSIADAVKPLNRLMLDFDEKGHTDEIVSTLNIKHETLNSCGIKVLLIEESVRRGTHVLVEYPAGMSPEKIQEIMKKVTGFEPDKQVKGPDRCIYMVPEDHTKYVNPKLFEATPTVMSSVVPPTPSVMSSGVPPTPVMSSVVPPTPSVMSSVVPPTSSVMSSGVETSPKGDHEISPRASLGRDDKRGMLEFKGIPYSSIIAEWWRRNGGEPAEGERNVKLHKLAVNLRAICDNRNDLLMQVMPRFGLNEAELKSVVDSACKEPPKGISKVMQQIIDALQLGISVDEIEDAEVRRDAHLRGICRPSASGVLRWQHSATGTDVDNPR